VWADARGRRASTDASCQDARVSNPRRSRAGRPYRRLRRWARHTPNGTIALNMIVAGVVLIIIAIVIAVVA
jgi:hypothetical protein